MEPLKSRRVFVRLSPGELERLRLLARSEGRSISAVIRGMIRGFFDIRFGMPVGQEGAIKDAK